MARADAGTKEGVSLHDHGPIQGEVQRLAHHSTGAGQQGVGFIDAEMHADEIPDHRGCCGNGYDNK